MPPPTKPRFSTSASLKGPGALQMLDEAVAFLRRTPLSVYVIYYMGALPYCAALIYFIFDMLQSAEAEQHLVPEALLVTATYFWMKTCQAVFSRRLLAVLEGHDPEPWTLRRWLNTALLQTIFSATFFFTWPLALAITLPFGWVHAFYHNVSIIGTGKSTTLRECLAESASLSALWPRQNHLILLTQFAGMGMLFLNLMVFLSLLPRLINIFLGITTVFDESYSAWNNSSFYLDVAVLTFLILNPLSKAVYVLRCFYGRARLSGTDLRAGLQRVRAAREAALLALLLGLLTANIAHADNAPPAVAPTPTTAAPAGVAPTTLNQAILDTLKKDEFSWRAPKPHVVHKDESSMERAIREFLDSLKHGLHAMFRPIREFLKWLFDNPRQHDQVTPSGAGMGSIPWTPLLWVVLGVAVALLVWLLVRNLRPESLKRGLASQPTPVKTIDLESESVRADALPEDKWLALAQELLEKGETRLALRALYLATLSLLAQRELIRLGPAKSNRDYLQELARRLRDRAEALSPFRGSVRLFEASWYGTHDVTAAVIEAMRVNHQTVRSHVAA
jgi:hypothetical protein